MKDPRSALAAAFDRDDIAIEYWGEVTPIDD